MPTLETRPIAAGCPRESLESLLRKHWATRGLVELRGTDGSLLTLSLLPKQEAAMLRLRVEAASGIDLPASLLVHSEVFVLRDSALAPNTPLSTLVHLTDGSTVRLRIPGVAHARSF